LFFFSVQNFILYAFDLNKTHMASSASSTEYGKIFESENLIQPFNFNVKILYLIISNHFFIFLLVEKTV